MSKPSAKHVKKRRQVRQGTHEAKSEDPRAEDVHQMVKGMLHGVRLWGLDMEAFGRQAYTPEAMQDLIARYLEIFPMIAILSKQSSLIEGTENPEAQKALGNAADVMTFFQGPLLDGVLNEKDPGVVMTEFVALLNESLDKPPEQLKEDEDGSNPDV